MKERVKERVKVKVKERRREREEVPDVYMWSHMSQYCP